MAKNRPTTSSGGDCTDGELGPASPKSPRAEQEAEQQMSYFKRLSGAALYKSTFQASWTKKWPFVKLVRGTKRCLNAQFAPTYSLVPIRVRGTLSGT